MDRRSFSKLVYWPLLWIAVLLPPIMFCGACSVDGYAGLAMIVLGSLIAVYSLLLTSIGGRTLRLYGHTSGKKSFWPDKFVDKGIYTCMRHPQHLGIALAPVAAALLAHNIVALASSGWGVAGALLFILAVEEPECIIKYRGEYYEYMKKTPAFNLDPRCLIEGLKTIYRRDRY